MQINFTDDAEKQSIAAGFANVEQYILSLLDRDRERLAIEEGLEAMRQGRVEKFDDFDARFRQQNGIAAE